jgi:pimeloyl-ACP methyl ester carboxylesterase
MIENAFAETNGVRLHYAAEGAGDLILFAHGFPEFWYAWKNQLAEFGRTHLAVAPDLRGYNLSSKPPRVEDYAVPLLVEDLRGLATHLGKKKFTLVGHDWGGVVAWAFAIVHPEMLERLIIINAPHPGIFERELTSNPEQRKASQYILLFRTPMAEPMLEAANYAALVASVLQEGLKKGYFTEDDRRAYVEAWSQPGALTGGLNYYRAAPLGSFVGGKVSFASELPSFVVRVPTLVIWGEQDIHLLPGNLTGLQQYVPDLTVRRVPEGSHWVIHEQPAAINAAIRGFLGANQ